MLIRELMNEAFYNEIGNQVTMIKLRSAADAEIDLSGLETPDADAPE